MNEIRHTPAPWGQEYCGLDTIKIFKTSDKRRVATIKVKSRRMDEANAAHIVACVNACAGIDPESIPELIEACKDLSGYAERVALDICDQDTGWFYQFGAATDKANNAITKATKED